METDHLGHWAGHTVAKVTAHGIFDHLTQLGNIVPLGNDTVTQGGSHIAPIHLVFQNLKDNLAHSRRLVQLVWYDKPPLGRVAAEEAYPAIKLLLIVVQRLAQVRGKKDIQQRHPYAGHTQDSRKP
jgi:hypothetical protein